MRIGFRHFFLLWLFSLFFTNLWKNKYHVTSRSHQKSSPIEFTSKHIKFEYLLHFLPVFIEPSVLSHKEGEGDRPHSWPQTFNPKRSTAEEWRNRGFRGYLFKQTPSSNLQLNIRKKASPSIRDIGHHRTCATFLISKTSIITWINLKRHGRPFTILRTPINNLDQLRRKWRR